MKAKQNHSVLFLLFSLLLAMASCQKALSPEEFFEQFQTVKEANYNLYNIPNQKRLIVKPAERQNFGIALDSAKYAESKIYYTDIFKMKDYYAATFTIVTDNFLTKWGQGIKELLLVTYTPEGEMIDQRMLGKFSMDHETHINIWHSMSNNDELFVEPNENNVLNIDVLVEIVAIGHDIVVLADGKIRNDRFSKFRYKGREYDKRQRYDTLRMNPPKLRSATKTMEQIRLETTYAVYSAYPDSVILQRAFFAAVPKTWKDFVDIYQYHTEKELSNELFFAMDDHLDALDKIYLTPEEVVDYYIRLADEASVSEPNLTFTERTLTKHADVIQLHLWDWTSKAPDLVVSKIKALPKERWETFWAYYFSLSYCTGDFTGNVRSSEFQRLSKFLRVKYSDMLPALERGYKTPTRYVIHDNFRFIN